MALPKYMPVPAQRLPIEDTHALGAVAAARPEPVPPDSVVRDSVLPGKARSLLAQARRSLQQAEACTRPADQYVAAHVAALRAATAVVIVRSRHPDRWQQQVSVWQLLASAAPELRSWSDFFAARSHRRTVAEAGSPGIAIDDADRLVGCASEFLTIVETILCGVRS